MKVSCALEINIVHNNQSCSRRSLKIRVIHRNILWQPTGFVNTSLGFTCHSLTFPRKWLSLWWSLMVSENRSPVSFCTMQLAVLIRPFKSHQSRCAALTKGLWYPFSQVECNLPNGTNKEKTKTCCWKKKSCLFCVIALQRKSFVQMFPIFTSTVIVSASLAITVGINTSCSCKKHSWGLYLLSEQDSTSQLICC